ncbi:MAG: TetR family transcriptional regulator [Planctomycetota bacterium]|jgi:AcrR family transcriptional regulator
MAILRAAEELLDERGLEGTGLTAIAERSGLSRANLYRYFDSREAILMELLLSSQDGWMSALEDGLAQAQGPGQVAAAIASTLAERPRFCVLMGVMAQQLELHLSVEDVRRFHTALVERTDRLMPALETALPDRDPRQLRHALGVLVMSAGGIWPYCHPVPVVSEVLQEEPFQHLRFQFEPAVRQLAAACLAGLPSR